MAFTQTVPGVALGTCSTVVLGEGKLASCGRGLLGPFPGINCSLGLRNATYRTWIRGFLHRLQRVWEGPEGLGAECTSVIFPGDEDLFVLSNSQSSQRPSRWVIGKTRN